MASVQNPTQNFTKYEKARILGARALQLAMNAPLLLKISEEDLQKINYDVLKIAEVELSSGVLPISIKKPFPEKKEGKLKRDPSLKVSDKKLESAEEEKIEEESSEIMELANPDDENENLESSDDSREYGE